jgi:hypothetical protein
MYETQVKMNLIDKLNQAVGQVHISQRELQVRAAVPRPTIPDSIIEKLDVKI